MASIHTLCNPYVRITTTGLTNTSYPTVASLITEPSGEGVYELRKRNVDSSKNVANTVEMVFLMSSTNTHNDTAAVRVYGMQPLRYSGSDENMWIPVLLREVNVTQGALTGLSDGTAGVPDEEYFVDTITAVTPSGSDGIISPAGDQVATLTIDARGCSFIKMAVQKATTTIAYVGALIREL